LIGAEVTEVVAICVRIVSLRVGRILRTNLRRPRRQAPDLFSHPDLFRSREAACSYLKVASCRAGAPSITITSLRATAMIAGTRTGRTAIAIAVVAAALASAAPAAPRAAADLRTLPPGLARALDAYNQATARSDTKTLAALVTEDYVLVNSDASVQGKASYLADFAAPGFKLDPYEIEQLIWRVRGDAALTAWRFKLSWTQDGRHQTRRLRIAHFWVNQGGRWRIAYTQLTRIPD
jgi:ketosteroid isomerase-like protein